MLRRRTIIVCLLLLLIAGGLVLGWFQMNRLLSSPALKGRIEEGASGFLHRPLTIEKLEWRPWPNFALIGRDVSIWEDDAKKHALAQAPAVEMRLGLLSFYRMSIRVKEMRFIGPDIFLREKENGTGNIRAIVDDIRTSPSAAPRKWGSLSFNRFVVEDGTLNSVGNKIKVTATGPFALSETTVYKGTVRSSDTAIEFEVGPRKDQIKIALNSPKADLEEVALWGRALASAMGSAEKPRAGDTKPIPVGVAIQGDNIRFRLMTFQHMKAAALYENGVTTVDPMEFSGFGGSITAKIIYETTSSTGNLNVSWTMANVQADDFFKSFGSTREVAGVIDSTGQFKATTASLLPTVNGEVKFHLKNGWFGNAPGLLKILSRINLTTAVTEIAGRHQSRVPFDDTRGVIEIINGVASTKEPFVLENKTLQMIFMGDYNMLTRSVKGQIAVNVLMVTDEIINKIPGVRDILLGDDKSLVPIWVSVKGPADDPKIKVSSVKSITGPVFNTLKNIIRLPKRIFGKKAEEE